MSQSRVKVIDLFAGAGALSIGAAAAGADVRVLVDNDPRACDTLRANRGHHRQATVLQADVASLTGGELREMAEASEREPLVVIGGPPCQPFSKAAYWVEEGEEAAYRRARSRGQQAERPQAPTEPRPDARRSLVEEFWRLVDESDATGFLFENVRSILHPRNRPAIERLAHAARAAGFQTRLVKANAADFGVPQKRERVFLLGSRENRPGEPKATHAEDPAEAGSKLPYETAGPALAPFASEEHFEPEEVVRGRWAEHLREIPPGWNYKHHTAWAGHPGPTFETETRFWNFLLKLSPALPSWTIPASPGPWTGPFHWDSRRLRTAEMAALQTFPVDYRFAGTRRERVRQIGNAVPTKLAAAMVAEVLATLVSVPEEAAA